VPEPPQATADTGLPPQVEWQFNLDAGWGVFGFAGSLYTDPKEGVGQGYGDRWAEGFVKASVSGTYRLASSSEIYGKLSAVGERTYANAPPLAGADHSSFLPEDLSIGWRSGRALAALGDNVLDVVIGRTPYTIGHGLLIWDGAAEGGSRGGYWSNARKAYEFAVVARFTPLSHTVETFYLAKDDLPENPTGSAVWGANYEYRIGSTSTFGATYMTWNADPGKTAERDGLDVYNLRAYTAPVSALPDLSFEVEYAAERNGVTLHSDALVAQVSYELSNVLWAPKLTYRYALFEGDDPATDRNENFDPLFIGFYDWGSWWQGEIAGEYFLVNSNLRSHHVRLHTTPHDALGTGLMFFKFLLDHPGTYAPGVTDRNLAFELDAYADWTINRHFTASFVAAYAKPHEAIRQAIERSESFQYGMVFLVYSY
jgi:hypothetical protein